MKISEIKEKMRQMYVSQNELNKKFSGEDWIQKIRPENFIAAMIAEYGEFLESAPRIGDGDLNGWKWWRNTENDIQNIKVEIIDIYHFFMSYMIQFVYYIYCEEKEIDIDKIIEKIVDILDTRPKIEDFNFSGLYNDYKKSPLVSSQNDLGDLIFSRYQGNIYKTFWSGTCLCFGLWEYFGWNFDEFYEMYFKKNDLNHKRIEGGYKEGKYQKIDELGEDNRKL